MSKAFSGRLVVSLSAFAVLLVAVPLAFAYSGRDGSSYGGGSGGSGGGYGDDYKFATIKDGTKLVTFGDRGSNSKQIRGLLAGERVVGIDVRPTDGNNNGVRDDGKLYGVGTVGTTGYVFEIDKNARVQNRRTLTVALNGNFFGVDFNPSVDRLRITSDNDQNLRANVDTGATLMDANIQYPANDRRGAAGATPVDPFVVGAGYTYAPLMGPTSLYDIDTANPDFFVLQNPPNDGTINSIGPIGVDAGGKVGFDIAGKDTFTAFELAQQGSRAKLYELRFDRNGKASSTGVSLSGSDYDGLAVLNGYGDGRGSSGGYRR